MTVKQKDMMTANQYEMIELIFHGPAPKQNEAQVDFGAIFEQDSSTVKINGFYAGEGVYKLRYFPEKAGICSYRTWGVTEQKGQIEILPDQEGRRGIVRAVGTHFEDESGGMFHPFGTTVYAMIHQKQELIEKTYHTLTEAPFNKIRICVFPKHSSYNENEPEIFPFEKNDGEWNPQKPCYRFWDALDKHVARLGEMGIEVDLVLFHPYDCWGLARMPQEKNLVYLDYAIRRFAAYPNIWWNLANEYEVSGAKTLEDWHELESYIAEHDPWNHLLSCHNIGNLYDPSRENITHISAQTKLFTRIDTWRKRYRKPVIIDECLYEGNLKELWGCISGREMVRRFWRTVISGGYCTHAETFYDSEDIIWWAKGGILKGESTERIRFCREIIEHLPGHIHRECGVEDKMLELAGKSVEEIDEIVQDKQNGDDVERAAQRNILRSFGSLGEEAILLASEDYEYKGCIADKCFLHYHNFRTPAKDEFNLPDDKQYRIRVIDTWEMTDTVVKEGVSGKTMIDLPGREDMLVLAEQISAKKQN